MHPRIWGLTYIAPTNLWVSVSAMGARHLKSQISNALSGWYSLKNQNIKLTITGTPSSRKYFDVVLFPVAAPPVSPIRNIAQALIRSRWSTKVSLSLSKFLSSLFVQSKSKSFFLSILTFVVLTQFFNVLESRSVCCFCWLLYWAASWVKIKTIPPQESWFYGYPVTYLDEVFLLNT